MAAFDRLPPELRLWLSTAILPWSPRSAARVYARALADARGDRAAALNYLRMLERACIAQEAPVATAQRG